MLLIKLERVFEVWENLQYCVKCPGKYAVCLKNKIENEGSLVYIEPSIQIFSLKILTNNDVWINSTPGWSISPGHFQLRFCFVLASKCWHCFAKTNV